jgi:hypothetical protein
MKFTVERLIETLFICRISLLGGQELQTLNRERRVHGLARAASRKDDPIRTANSTRSIEWATIPPSVGQFLGGQKHHRARMMSLSIDAAEDSNGETTLYPGAPGSSIAPALNDGLQNPGHDVDTALLVEPHRRLGRL